MEKKYEMTNETIEYCGKTLHRIKASRDFSNVKKGELGGFVESLINLSHKGECWIYDNAMAFENSVVRDDAVIQNNVKVCGFSSISNCALLEDNVRISGHAVINGNAIIVGNAEIYGNSQITDNASISGDSIIYGHAIISGSAIVTDNAIIYNKTHISGVAIISKNAIICGDPYINRHEISTDAYIRSNMDFMSIDGLGSENRTTYFYKTKNDDIFVICGCFRGNLDEFKKKVEYTYPDVKVKYGNEYLKIIDLVKYHFDKG